MATSASTDQAAAQAALASGEEREPGQEDALAPVGVGPAAGGDEQRGEDDRVRVEDPAQAAEAGAGELVLEGREGDVHDEEVEARHERAEADDDDGDASALRHRTDRSAYRCVMQRSRLDSVAMLPSKLRQPGLLDRPRARGRRASAGRC